MPLDFSLLTRYGLMGLDDEGFAALERGLTKAEPTLARVTEIGGVVGLVTAMHEAWRGKGHGLRRRRSRRGAQGMAGLPTGPRTARRRRAVRLPAACWA
ncbi:MAG: hypothetical protein IPI35_34815 [Deltaproteobacteria bacterium]|nr:hypothetical protein [Deltaproteobacteria bacterium]